MADDFKSQQTQEVESLQAIYPADEFGSTTDGFFLTITVHPKLDAMRLYYSYPARYPAEPPVYTLAAPWLSDGRAALLSNKLDEMYAEHGGSVVMFDWAEWLRANTTSFLNLKDLGPATEDDDVKYEDDLSGSDLETVVSTESDGLVPSVHHGTTVTVQKSRFTAHCALVSTMRELELAKTVILQSRKVASATHNIVAYRVYETQEDGTTACKEGRDDDGEHRAGDQLLDSLQRAGVRNVLVIVSRRYGGVQLGADRFRVILQVARELLLDLNLIPGQEPRVAKVVTFKPGCTREMKRKMRPADEVYKRIIWDKSLDRKDFVIGYEDRFEGIIDTPFDNFQVEDNLAYEGIPFHRIRHFKHKGVIVWDRKARLDTLYSENSTQRPV